MEYILSQMEDYKLANQQLEEKIGKWKKEIESELNRYDVNAYGTAKLHIRCNYRYDLDNCIMVSKFVCDSLVDLGFLPNDSTKYLGEIKLSYDNTVKKDTSIVKIYLR